MPFTPRSRTNLILEGNAADLVNELVTGSGNTWKSGPQGERASVKVEFIVGDQVLFAYDNNSLDMTVKLTVDNS